VSQTVSLINASKCLSFEVFISGVTRGKGGGGRTAPCDSIQGVTPKWN